MDWDSSRTTPASARLARLRRDLDDVADQAREAAAAAVGRSVADAVAGAVLAALSPAGRRDRHSRRPSRPYQGGVATSRDGDGPARGRDDDYRNWSDTYARDQDGPGYDGESGRMYDPPHDGDREGRSSLALAFGLRAAWWLGRPGRTSLAAALAVGALAALAGHALFTLDHDDDSTNSQRRPER